MYLGNDPQKLVDPLGFSQGGEINVPAILVEPPRHGSALSLLYMGAEYRNK